MYINLQGRINICFTLYKKYGYYGTVGNDDQPSRKQLLERSLLLMPARSGDLS